MGESTAGPKGAHKKQHLAEILGVSGSPVKNSNTDRLIRLVMDSAGLRSEFVKLSDCRIGPCRACMVADFMDELAGTENRIAVERMRYNEEVRDYNTKVKKFPSNVVAGLFGFDEKDYYDPLPGEA